PGAPPGRFDQRGMETGQSGLLGHRQPKGPATDKASLRYRATSLLYPFGSQDWCQGGSPRQVPHLAIGRGRRAEEAVRPSLGADSPLAFGLCLGLRFAAADKRVRRWSPCVRGASRKPVAVVVER